MIVLLALLLAGPSLPSAVARRKCAACGSSAPALASPESVDQRRGRRGARRGSTRSSSRCAAAATPSTPRASCRAQRAAARPARGLRPAGAPARARPRARPAGARVGERPAHRALRPAAAPPATSAARHPDWLMVPQDAAAARALERFADRDLAAHRSAIATPRTRKGFYLSPSAPGAAAHLEQVVSELVRARTPWTACTSTSSAIPAPTTTGRARRSKASGATRGGGDLLAGPAVDPEGWGNYRRAVLDDLTVRLERAPRGRRGPGSSSPRRSSRTWPKALYQRYQAWPAWMARGVLDAVCPMAYTPDTRLFRAQVEQARARLGAAASALGRDRRLAAARRQRASRRSAPRVRRARPASSCSRTSRSRPRTSTASARTPSPRPRAGARGGRAGGRAHR